MTITAQHQRTTLVVCCYSLTAFAMLLVLTAPLPASAQIQTFHSLHTFSGRADGAEPFATLVEDAARTAISAPATTTFTSLVNFFGGDGANPYTMSLIQGTDGNFYGTTQGGGISGPNCTGGCGTVFKIIAGGTLTTLHKFDYSDGSYPNTALVLATDGNFYGTTAAGGSNGCGTFFKITTKGTLTTLYNFCSQGGSLDGTGGHSLVQAADGDFYSVGGSGGAYNNGTVFKITSKGKITVLHNFTFFDGDGPVGLVQGRDGNFYGTTVVGGANNGGTVFKITPRGALTTLYNFCAQTNCTDGANPHTGLIQASNGNFYGTTYSGGSSRFYGTVFGITPKGALTTLHSFCSSSNCGDGDNPTAELVQATDGDLYGTTTSGGENGYGDVFRIRTGGTLTVLHSFDLVDGSIPFGGLFQATNGNFYGASYAGGTSTSCNGGCGTVFSLSVGLGPFVETLPTSGKVGAAVKILGTNLTGATSVTFNGTAAVFGVVSSSEIMTIVPAGATTGKVKVVMPHGTLFSNVPFRVLP
jgi:uncharacterized repeat protein (TIGR03803 family)